MTRAPEVTHAARDAHPVSSPDGMALPRCGWRNDGHGIAVAWERRFVDCPMCLLIIDSVPVIGTAPATIVHSDGELPVRTPRRPDYVPEGHIYVPPEFRIRRRRRLNVFQCILLWIMLLLVIVTVAALYARWTDNVGSGPAPVIVETPTTYGPPPPAYAYGGE